jgi:hypothetical protein
MMREECSMFNAQCSMNGQWPMANALPIAHCPLPIGFTGGDA